MQDLIQQGLSDLVYGGESGLLLLSRHIPKQTAISLNLFATHPIERVAKQQDRGSDFSRLHPRAESLNLVIDDLFRAPGFFQALLHVRADDLLQIIDVVNERVIDVVDRRIDVAWHSNIDEEHGLSEIEITFPNGSVILFDWNLASYVEFQKAVELKRDLEEDFSAPFVLGENGKSESIANREELLEKVLGLAKKDLSMQRYKGLGEMNPEQLWETTMDPTKRILLKVQIEDAISAGETFSTLMGDEVEPRRQFIESNALGVTNLDV